MNKTEIKHRLIEIGYPERHLDIVSNELLAISDQLRPLMEKWIENGTEEDYAVRGYSLRELCECRNLKYPAAILTMDWLIKEPEIAIQHISRKRR